MAEEGDTGKGDKETKESKGDSRTKVDGPIICPGHSRPVPDLSFSKVTEDGYFLISACLDGKAMIREGVSGDWIGTFLGHKGAVWCARLNETADRAVTGSADFTAKLWNAVSGDEIHSWLHKHIVKASVFSKDSSFVYTGGQETKLRIFDVNKPDTEPQIFEGHSASISSIITVPDANLIVSSAKEANVRIWDKRTKSAVKSLQTASPVTHLSMSADEKTIACAAEKKIHFWNASTFELIKTFDLPRTIESVAYHPTSKRFVTGCPTELWVRGYEFDSGNEIVCNKGHHGPVRCLSFSPSGEAYASGSEDGTIRIWEWAHETKQETDTHSSS